MRFALLLGVCVTLFLGSEALTDIEMYDEGVRLYGAMRVLHGQVPYHDFFTLYGPGQFYWLAAWFFLLGEQLLSARLGELFSASTAVGLMAVFAIRAGLGYAGILWVLLSMLLPFVDVQLITIDPSLALDLAAGVVVLSGNLNFARLALAGLALGMASLFRHDFALYGAVAVAAAIAARLVGPGSTLAILGLTLRKVSIAGLFALLVALPAYGVLAWRNPMAVWDCLIAQPPRLMVFRSIPYRDTLGATVEKLFRFPSPNNLVRLWVVLAPFFAGTGLAVLLVRSRLRTLVCRRPPQISSLVFLLTLAGGLAIYASVRSDIFHIYPLHIAANGAIAIVGSCGMRAVDARFIEGQICRAFTIFLGVVLAAAVASSVGRTESRSTVDSARVRGIRVNRAGRIVVQAVDELERFAGEGPVFVGSVRHDRDVAYPMTAYFMIGRRAATYFHELLPGLTTTESVQRQMVRDIGASGACAVLLWGSASSSAAASSFQSSESASRLIDDYFNSHFRVGIEREQYRVLTRCEPSTVY